MKIKCKCNQFRVKGVKNIKLLTVSHLLTVWDFLLAANRVWKSTSIIRLSVVSFLQGRCSSQTVVCVWWRQRCTALIYASQSRVKPARQHAGEIYHHRWGFINQSLSFSPPELTHSPTQLTQLPIKSVGVCQHRILPLMQTHAHSRVCCVYVEFLTLHTTCVFEWQFKKLLTSESNRSNTGSIDRLFQQKQSTTLYISVLLCAFYVFFKITPVLLFFAAKIHARYLRHYSGGFLFLPFTD